MDVVNSRSPSSSPHIIVIAFHTRRLVGGLAPFRQRTSAATEKLYYLILTFVQLYVTAVITSCSSTGTNVKTSYRLYTAASTTPSRRQYLRTCLWLPDSL
ncbi:hypothetical protein BYT27DRAFT_7179674, partial [Phlegmacium glaucopus]